MEPITNPYARAAKLLLAKSTLTADQLARLVFLNHANSFWTSLYNQPYEYLYKEIPLDKYKDRTQEGQNYVNNVYFLLDWLRCYCLYRYSYEANALDAEKNIRIYLVEAAKNEAWKANSNKGKNVLRQLRELLKAEGYKKEPWGIIEANTAEGWDALGIPKEKNPLYLIRRLESILDDVDANADGYQLIEPEASETLATEARREADSKREAYEEPSGEKAPSLAEVEKAEEEADLAEEEAARELEERKKKEAVLTETFTKLADYILFLRGTRIFMEELAKRFKTTPEAFVSRPDTLGKIKAEAVSIIHQLEVFTSFKYEGQRLTMEEADKVADEIEALKAHPSTWKEYREKLAKVELCYNALDLDGFANIAEPWETKNFWRKLALKLKAAVLKEWRPKDRDMAKLRISRFSFFRTPSDMDYLNELCGTKNLGF